MNIVIQEFESCEQMGCKLDSNIFHILSPPVHISGRFVLKFFPCSPLTFRWIKKISVETKSWHIWLNLIAKFNFEITIIA